LLIGEGVFVGTNPSRVVTVKIGERPLSIGRYDQDLGRSAHRWDSVPEGFLPNGLYGLLDSDQFKA
jgi:hypothetical protein